jgi:predicted ATPase
MQSAVAQGLCGSALIDLGEATQGMHLIKASLLEGEQLGLRLGRTSKLRRLAAGAATMKQWDAAADYSNQAIEEADSSGERWYAAELERYRGELLLLRDDAAAMEQAEACFLRALEMARSQGAKAWELRAATSFARMWQQHGKENKARDLLAEIYNWFTEGFDTKDLKEAKALLQQLA